MPLHHAHATACRQSTQQNTRPALSVRNAIPWAAKAVDSVSQTPPGGERVRESGPKATGPRGRLWTRPQTESAGPDYPTCRNPLATTRYGEKLAGWWHHRRCKQKGPRFRGPGSLAPHKWPTNELVLSPRCHTSPSSQEKKDEKSWEGLLPFLEDSLICGEGGRKIAGGPSGARDGREARPARASRDRPAHEMPRLSAPGSASNVMVNRTAQRGQRVREQRAERAVRGRKRFTGGERSGGRGAAPCRKLLGFNRLGARLGVVVARPAECAAGQTPLPRPGRPWRERAKRLSSSISRLTSASFFARDHRLTWVSRRRASAKVTCSSEYTTATGRSSLVVRQAVPARCSCHRRLRYAVAPGYNLPDLSRRM